MQDGLGVTLILLASAVAVVVMFRKLSLPAILGYLIVRGLWSMHLRRAWNARRRRTTRARSDQAG